MFLVKRDNSNKNYIIKGFITAILLSAFIFLSHFNVESRFLYSILGLAGIYALLTIPAKSLFFAGFTTGILWFYWMGISLKYYDLLYLTPILLLALGIGYGIIFRLFALIDYKIFRVLMIFAFTFVAPFGFNWMKFELIFIDSYFGVEKEDLALILISMYALSELPRLKVIALIPLIFAYQSLSGIYINNPHAKIHMPQFNINQDKKWEKDYQTKLINSNLTEVNNAISLKKDLVILPETAMPTVLNRSNALMEILKDKSYEIDIITGALYLEKDQVFNATYHFSKGEVQIAKKVVLVPFGEEIPLPEFFVNLINNTFYNGAKDYAKADKPTDFEIKGDKFRNAICYEATTDKIFENLNGVKYMIATSNNAWFTPSTEPTLQKLLLRYYSKKYDITIFHVANGSKNHIFRP